MENDQGLPIGPELQQEPFESVEFSDNPEPRCPCILLLDTSGSMQGEPIRQLNEGIIVFKDQVVADQLAAKRVEISVVSFGPVTVEQNFRSAMDFLPTPLTAKHDTPMGSAILTALDLLRTRKAEYNANGISYFRPWIFLITDGAPTDEWQSAASEIREGETQKAFAFFAVGVENADMDVLAKISVRQPLKLKGLDFRKMFEWLSNSLRTVSRSNPGDEIPLINPTGPDGWATLSL